MATITGTILEPNGSVAKRTRVTFEMDETVIVGDAVYPKSTADVNTDENGELPSGLTLVAGVYKVTAKLQEFYIEVPAGDGTYDISEIDYSGTSHPGTVAATFGFFQVSTVAELQTIPTRAVNKQAQVLGLSSANDGGGGLFTWDSTGTTANDGYIVARPSDYATAGVWRRATDGVYNAKWFGFRDGQNCTSAFAAIVSTVPTKSKIVFPDGTYTLSTVAISKDLSLVGTGTGNTIFKHAASASNHMLRHTVAQTGVISGITFDGNKSNQSIASNWFGLFSTYADGLTIRDCTFQNFMRAGIYDVQSLKNITVDNCKFLNGVEIPDSDSTNNAAGFIFAPGLATGSPHVRVTGCEFKQDSAPASEYRTPGGFYLAGSDANSSYNSLVLTHNKFLRVGDANPSGVGIAAIDIYEDTKNCIVAFNIVEECGYIAFKMQNVQNLLCEGNIAKNCTYTSVFVYTPGERSQEAEYKTSKIIGNTVETATSAIGYTISAGDSGGWHEIIVANNSARDVSYGLYIEGADQAGNNEGFGPVLVSGNQFWASGQNGIHIATTQALMLFTDNYVEVTTGNGLVATTQNSASRLVLRGNYFKTNTAAYTGVRVWGVAEVAFAGNRFDCVTEAVELKQDASANLIGRFQWENNNVIISGSTDITVADISAGYMHSGNSFRAFPNSGSAAVWTKADGATNLLKIDSTNGNVVVGTTTTSTTYPFLAGLDQASIANLILARNQTAGGAANIQLASDTSSGGVRAWSTTFATAYLADKFGLFAEPTASALLLAAPGSGQTIDLYGGDTNLSGQFDGNATAGNTRFLLWDVTAGSLKRVSVGASDSGGSGFKLLRVPN